MRNKILNWWNQYNNLSDECKQLERIQEYTLNQLSKICNVAELKGFKTPSEYILKYASINGHCGAFEKDNEIVVGIGTYTGELDEDGFGKQYTVTLLDGTTFTGTIGVDVVVLKNNNLGFSDIPSLSRYAKMLADVDCSMEMNVIYTRVCPIPIVDSDIEKKSMENVIKSLFDGKFNIFKRNVGTKLLSNESNAQNVLNLTQPQASVYLQNLSRFHDELIIRQCLEMGVSVTARDKGAQLNDSELNAFTPYAMISANDRIKQIRTFIEECKRVFNREFSFEVNDFLTVDNNGKQDIVDVTKKDNEDIEKEGEENETI